MSDQIEEKALPEPRDDSQSSENMAVYEKFRDAFLCVLEEIKSQNSDVTDEQAKRFTQSFLGMIDIALSNPEVKGVFFQDYESMMAIDGSKQSPVDLDAHTDNISKELSLNKTEDIFSDKTDYVMDVYGALNNGKRISPNLVQEEITLCLDIVKNLRDGSAQVNHALDEMIKKYGEINFNVVDGEKIDGHAQIIDKNGEKSVVVDISKSAFENQEVLPFLIAHELGHALDYIERPEGSNGTIKEKEERLADIAAFRMLRGAGYGLDYTRAFVEKVLGKSCNTDGEMVENSGLEDKRAFALAKDVQKEEAAVKSGRLPKGNNDVQYNKGRQNNKENISAEPAKLVQNSGKEMA